jgi:hypothetical protein
MHETDVEVLQALWLSGHPEMPPEPVPGDHCSADAFPGAGFETGQVLDYEAMNSWAEVYGWSCRFRHEPYLGPHLFYPEAGTD